MEIIVIFIPISMLRLRHEAKLIVPFSGKIASRKSLTLNCRLSICQLKRVRLVRDGGAVRTLLADVIIPFSSKYK